MAKTTIRLLTDQPLRAGAGAGTPRHGDRATIRRMELRLAAHLPSIGDFVIYVAEALALPQ
jgi:hypothetical protein